MNLQFPEEFEEFSHKKAFIGCFMSAVAALLSGISSKREPSRKPPNLANAFQAN
jgi:hypothetical protein